MKQETSSATEEEMELRIGRGSRGLEFVDDDEGMDDSKDLVAS